MLKVEAQVSKNNILQVMSVNLTQIKGADNDNACILHLKGFCQALSLSTLIH